MSESPGDPPAESRGDRRDNDRRGGDRRRTERRLPTPLWRRPWAYAAYGVAGALLVVLLLTSMGEDEAPRDEGQVVTVMAPPPIDPNAPAAAGAPVQDAYGVGDFERLIAEGEGAVGQPVRTELFCESIGQVTLRDVDAVNRSIVELADANRRVPAADCKWGSGETAPDFVLLVPPALAGSLASAPEVTQGFVARRQLNVELEWVGRSEALALRNAGVLRQVR